MSDGGVPGMPPLPNPDVEALGSLMSYQPGEEIYAGPNTGYCYRIASGAARKFVLFPDGRRQIVDFLFAGDYVNMRERHLHNFIVEALVPATTVMRYPFHAVMQLAEHKANVATFLLQCAYAAMERSDARVVMLGRVTAVEKVGSFIAILAERSASVGGIVTLPMPRSDVADYLGISVETVSRAFTALRMLGAIALLDARTVRILSRAKLINPRGRD